jgi:hypothetical protein
MHQTGMVWSAARMNANASSSGFPARDLSPATGCLQIAAAGRRVCVPWASREAAKPRRETQRWVFGVRLAKRRTGVRGWVLSEARAFQPEIRPLRLAACRLPLRGGGFCVPWASREDAKPRRETQRWVFGVRLAKRRTGVRGWVLSVARAFQPEICPLRLAACRLPLRGGGFVHLWLHAKTGWVGV